MTVEELRKLNNEVIESLDHNDPNCVGLVWRFYVDKGKRYIKCTRCNARFEATTITFNQAIEQNYLSNLLVGMQRTT